MTDDDDDYDELMMKDDDDDDWIPFQGYRHVTLLSGSGSSLAPACLFVHVQIEKLQTSS